MVEELYTPIYVLNIYYTIVVHILYLVPVVDKHRCNEQK